MIGVLTFRVIEIFHFVFRANGHLLSLKLVNRCVLCLVYFKHTFRLEVFDCYMSVSVSDNSNKNAKRSLKTSERTQRLFILTKRKR